MKKAIIALVVGASVVLTACSSVEMGKRTESFMESSTASSAETLTMVGAWSPIHGDQDSEISQDALKAFEKATKDLEGYTYEVIAVLGSQVVSGMNYVYLCKGEVVSPEASPEYLLVTVYEDLEGKAEITETEELLEAAVNMNHGTGNID
ncbi:MAG: hypothetical protein Q4G57_08470 [Bacillota bacterium]|nr:hypothetical protein [Bacillota bacterium]